MLYPFTLRCCDAVAEIEFHDLDSNRKHSEYHLAIVVGALSSVAG
jgi:hypothetical protein